MYAKTVLGNRVQLLHTGKAQGNFSPRVADFTSRFDLVRLALRSPNICAPRLEFTNRWISTWETGEGGEWKPNEVLFWRSVQTADGVILPPPESEAYRDVILTGFNADCPFGIILWPDGRLGFCHLGLECVLPKDGSPGILDTAPFEEGCVVHITAGIGPCCYGRDDGGFDYVFERFPEAQGGRAIAGPRKGQPSLNLHQLIRSVLARHDITAVSEDGLCTACAAIPDGKRLYYSNVADRGTPDEGGRNCVAVRRITL